MSLKKKHWWRSDALKWSALGLLGLLVGATLFQCTENAYSPLPLLMSSAVYFSPIVSRLAPYQEWLGQFFVLALWSARHCITNCSSTMADF